MGKQAELHTSDPRSNIGGDGKFIDLVSSLFKFKDAKMGFPHPWSKIIHEFTVHVQNPGIGIPWCSHRVCGW